MAIYYDFISQDISPSAYSPNRVTALNYYGSSVFFDLSMKQEVQGIPEQHLSRVVPQFFSSKYGQVNSSKMFFTDGSSIEGSSGFGVFNENISAFHKLSNPCSVYVAELAAIYFAMNIIESLPSDHYFIFTDSLSSLEALRSMKHEKHTSYFILKIQESLSIAVENNIKITFVWIPSHCSIPGNEKADSLAKQGALEGTIYERMITFQEFFVIPRQQALVSWQTQWNEDELGRWLFSILPQVKTKAWFNNLEVDRDFIRTISRLMSNHYTLNAHFYRIKLADSNLCGCGGGYHDIEHVVWTCPEYCVARSRFADSLRAQGRQLGVPVRDILASLDMSYLHCLYRFLKSVEVRV